MKLLVVSDLHIGSGDSCDVFGWNHKTFKNFIEGQILSQGIDKVIINGDFFELYKYKYSEVEKHSKDLIEYLTGDAFIYIHGNHDITKQALSEYDITNSKGQTIHFEHGHKADFLNGTLFGRSLGRFTLATIRQVSLMSAKIRKLYLHINLSSENNNYKPRKYNTLKYLQYALNKLKHYDMVVLGHTHKVETHETYYNNTKKYYLNSGSCSIGKFQGLIIDTETLRYETLKF